MASVQFIENLVRVLDFEHLSGDTYSGMWIGIGAVTCDHAGKIRRTMLYTVKSHDSLLSGLRYVKGSGYSTH